jgi:hypothetical protein
MPTVVTKTVDPAGGYDFTSINAALAARPASLVVADEQWDIILRPGTYISTGTTLNLSGSVTTDATRFTRIRCADGASFRDHVNKLTNALLPNASNGVLVTQTGLDSSTPTVVVDEEYAEVFGIQISATVGSSDGIDSPPALRVGASTAKVRWLLAESYSGNHVVKLGACVPKYCYFIKRRHSGFVAIPTTVINVGLDNCSLLVPSNVDLGGGTYFKPHAIQRNYNTTTLRNPTIFGTSGLTGSGVGTINTTNGVADFTASGFTTVAFDTSTGSGFQNTTNDFRVKSTSAMAGAGATYAGILTEDIIGQTVAGTPSAGAWEAAGGGSTPVTFTGTVPTINATVGTAGSVDLASYFSGTLTPFTYSTFAGTLPTGFSRTGSVISWTTGTVAGTTTGIQIRATDTGSNVATTNAFNIVVAAAPAVPFLALSDFKNWSGTLQASVTIPKVLVLNPTTGAIVLNLSSVTTTAGADMTIADASLVSGTWYLIVGWHTDRSAAFRVFVQAQT